jgi:hypothetical protein
LAPSGGVCVSRMVYENVRDRIDLPFKGLGEQSVKILNARSKCGNGRLQFSLWKVWCPSNP